MRKEPNTSTVEAVVRRTEHGQAWVEVATMQRSPIIRGNAGKSDNTLTPRRAYVTFSPAYLPSLWCKPSSNVAGFLFPGFAREKWRELSQTRPCLRGDPSQPRGLSPTLGDIANLAMR